MPDRTVEMSSYHALLGCAVAGMGIALMPRSVLEFFPEHRRLSAHRLPPAQGKASTVMIWRKGARSPKVSALAELLTASSQPGGGAARRRIKKR